MHLKTLLTLTALISSALGAAGSMCVAPPLSSSVSATVHAYNYTTVLSQGRSKGIVFDDLPGFTRSVYKSDHALITPESRVWAGQPGWKNALTTHLISPGTGRAHFTMFMAQLKEDGEAGRPAAGVERFVLVLEGQVTVTASDGNTIQLQHNDYAYFPVGDTSSITSSSPAGLLLFERVYALKTGKPSFFHGNVDDSPVLPVAGEVFELRKLLPQTSDYDFNVHVMDFKSGEYLFVKEVHYNQHGLLLLQGQGIYRLGDSWYPVQTGDAIWMAPFVPQWYGALGSTSSRYILYKDTIVDPLLSA